MTTTTTSSTTSTTTTPIPPLAVVKTSLYRKINGKFVEALYTDASNSDETKNQLFAQALDFGTLAPGETSETIAISLNVPYCKAIANIRLGLISVGDLAFTTETFGVTSSIELRDDIIPEDYFLGINTTDPTQLDTDYTISIPNNNNFRSTYVYLNIKLPTNQNLGRGLVKYKWYFAYAS